MTQDTSPNPGLPSDLSALAADKARTAAERREECTGYGVFDAVAELTPAAADIVAAGVRVVGGALEFLISLA